jgi:hypothetical protein
MTTKVNKKLTITSSFDPRSPSFLCEIIYKGKSFHFIRYFMDGIMTIIALITSPEFQAFLIENDFKQSEFEEDLKEWIGQGKYNG